MHSIRKFIGIVTSKISISFENLFNIRPRGVVSKKYIGLLRILKKVSNVCTYITTYIIDNCCSMSVIILSQNHFGSRFIIGMHHTMLFMYHYDMRTS